MVCVQRVTFFQRPSQFVAPFLPTRVSTTHCLIPAPAPPVISQSLLQKQQEREEPPKPPQPHPARPPRNQRQIPARHPKAQKKKARNTTSLISARCSTAKKANPRTYIQGRIEEGGAMFLVCGMTEKKNSNHKEDMEKVAYACVRFSLCCCRSCT